MDTTEAIEARDRVRRRIDMELRSVWYRCNGLAVVLDDLHAKAEEIGDTDRANEIFHASLTINSAACEFHPAIDRLRAGGAA